MKSSPTQLFFKLSIISLALYQAQLTQAEDITLNTIQLKASSPSTLSSEETKAYTVKNSSSATKLDLEIQDTPQTVNVITRQQINDFNLNSTRRVLENTPGVTVQSQETERTSYTARGYEISNILTDGVGYPMSSYNYSNTDPDTFFYDRVEVTKGADALNSAFGDPSATINNIRKRPTKDLKASLGLSYGSWNTQRYDADVSGPLTDDGKIRGRLMGFEQTGNSYLDRYSAEKNGFAGVIEADLTDTTQLSVGYSEQKHKPNANNWGALPLLNNLGQQISYDRSYNPNPDWAFWDKNIQSGFIELKQKLGDNWTAKLTYNGTKTSHDSRLLYYYGYPDQNGAGVSLTAWGGKERLKQDLANFDLSGTYTLFNRQHEASVGYSYVRSRQHDMESNGTIHDTNVVDGITTDWASWTPQSVTWSGFSDAADYKQNINSFYAATRLHLTNDLKFIVGGNYVEAKSKGVSYNSDMFYDESKFSPYTAFTYTFNPEYTGYISYTSIFRPQSGVGTDAKALKPIDGKSYEVGLKSSWLDGQLTGNFAIFKTDLDNYTLRSSDGLPTTRKSIVSNLSSQGVEVDLAGNITDNVNLSFGFSQFSLKDKKNGGNARTYIPTQTINLLTTYTMPTLPQLKLGAGVRWQNSTKQYDTSLNPGQPYVITQEGYALVDVMASYEVNKYITLQANGYNITDKKYLKSFPDGQAFYGEPANYTVGIRFNY